MIPYTIEEITNIVYDTLMENTQHPQFDIEKIEHQEVDAKRGMIRFVYGDTPIRIKLVE